MQKGNDTENAKIAKDARNSKKNKICKERKNCK